MLLISAHADTNFRSHSLERRGDGSVCGYLDNFVGVHATMLAYFSGRIRAPHTRIELTYGEELGLLGAREVVKTLHTDDVVLVVDVTGVTEPVDFTIEKCSNPAMRAFLESTFRGLKFALYEDCPDPVASCDESDVYGKRCPHTAFIGLPCLGGDYNAEPVVCRRESIEAVAEALCRAAESYPAFAEEIAARAAGGGGRAATRNVSGRGSRRPWLRRLRGE